MDWRKWWKEKKLVDPVVPIILNEENEETTAVLRFEDSQHCALYKDHPEEYNRTVEEGLEKIAPTTPADH